MRESFSATRAHGVRIIQGRGPGGNVIIRITVNDNDKCLLKFEGTIGPHLKIGWGGVPLNDVGEIRAEIQFTEDELNLLRQYY